jgi:hypothetical protein
MEPMGTNAEKHLEPRKGTGAEKHLGSIPAPMLKKHLGQKNWAPMLKKATGSRNIMLLKNSMMSHLAPPCPTPQAKVFDFHFCIT